MLLLVLEHTMFTSLQQTLHVRSEANGRIAQAGNHSYENTVDPVDFHQNILYAGFYFSLVWKQVWRMRLRSGFHAAL